MMSKSDEKLLHTSGGHTLIQTTKNLERFCNEVLENKLFWTPKILAFFETPKNQLKSFEKERDKEQKTKECALIDGVLNTQEGNDYRRQSYADLNAESSDEEGNHSVEEDHQFETGNSKDKVVSSTAGGPQNHSAGHIANFQIFENYATGDYLSPQVDPLQRGRYPLSV